MNVRTSRLARLVALTVVASLPVLGVAGGASAKAEHATVNCAKHPEKKKCQSGGTSGGIGTTNPPITVTVDPNGTQNPLFEVGQSEVYAVVQVETLASFAGDTVTISSDQLANSCEDVEFGYIPPGSRSSSSITVTLDNEGNATVLVDGLDCAPGSDLVEADLAVAPYYTATVNVYVNPPTVTTPGVLGEPQTAGQAEEVETGDMAASGDSDIYAVFVVEENPVYAEQPVEIGSAQLEDRCGGGWIWNPSNAFVPPNTGAPGSTYSGIVTSGSLTGTVPETVLDDDGNAAFVFAGASCAAGPSVITAEVLAGTHDTFTTTFTVEPPAVTI